MSEVLDSTPTPTHTLGAVEKVTAIIWGSKGLRFTGTFIFGGILGPYPPCEGSHYQFFHKQRIHVTRRYEILFT